MGRMLLNWIMSTIAVAITAYLLPGVVISGFIPALVAALVIGIINVILRPLLIILTLPLTILTLGLFALVINSGLILLAAAIVPGFWVDGFWWALIFSFVLSLVTMGIHAMGRSARE